MLFVTEGPQAVREAGPGARGMGLVIIPWERAVEVRARRVVRVGRCIFAVVVVVVFGG